MLSPSGTPLDRDQVRAKFARLVNADADDIAFVTTAVRLHSHQEAAGFAAAASIISFEPVSHYHVSSVHRHGACCRFFEIGLMKMCISGHALNA
ncbi:hypothetical protein GJA_1748 [Janthinobacterium agaricidamnosum NBRC 102515 = DSM 9628]|uniref:Uncharacterized protein n=2 Tax=Janthinobacterium agaricidamnosum TaxID=55508 RepID=W0V0M7_9BURK|nr:hypothetical protein GJA_1748 [Janthinobacterium agaricidamnosum NBRC 102515 = DSM 9628]